MHLLCMILFGVVCMFYAFDSGRGLKTRHIKVDRLSRNGKDKSKNNEKGDDDCRNSGATMDVGYVIVIVACAIIVSFGMTAVLTYMYMTRYLVW